MKNLSLEHTLISRGYLDQGEWKKFAARHGDTPDRILPALVGAKILLDTEACYYLYGCEEFDIEEPLKELARAKKEPDWLRDLFREYISTGKTGQEKFEDFLISTHRFTETEVFQMLARKAGVSFFSSEEYQPEVPLEELMPIELIRRFECLPIGVQEGVLHLACYHGLDRKAEIEAASGKKVKMVLSCPSFIRKWVAQAARGVIKTASDPATTMDDFFDDENNLTAQKLADPSDSIVRLLNQLIFQAIEERASDLHFEPQESRIQVKFRIDGVLFPVGEIDKKQHQALSGRIKIISELDTTQKRLPQDGRFKLKANGRRIDFRVSIIPCIFGESIVIRILDKLVLDLNLNHLGFSRKDLDLFEANIFNPYGMILVSGPTGSGKTTTLYSALSRIKTPEVEIITIEDPVEYIMPGIIQIAVNEKQGLTFENGLRSIVRHDPDIIMVGEIRDPATATIAIQASLTGHLVFSTIHCNNTIDVISRFENMGIETYEFASAANLLIAQRLVRRLCPACREPDPAGKGLFRGKGCPACKGRGFHGRTGIFEVLPMNESIKTMILARQTPFSILDEARNQGLLTLREAGLEKVHQGLTTLDEVNAVTMDPQSFGWKTPS